MRDNITFAKKRNEKKNNKKKQLYWASLSGLFTFTYFKNKKVKKKTVKLESQRSKVCL